VVHSAAEYLSHVAERPCTPVRHQEIPDGWSLFAGVVARRLAEAPAGLESLHVQTDVGLIPSGGIRIGNRWSWLQGAPPRIIVTGSEPELPVTVDGNVATVGDDGVLQSDPLAALGPHVIQIGALRRTVEIVEPSFPVDSHTPQSQSTGSRAPVSLALPAGKWTVVGQVPGEIARPTYAHRNGTIVQCDFIPMWAIRIGETRGAVALNLSAGPPPAVHSSGRLPIAVLSKPGCLAWASAIYEVAIRHPRVDSLIAQENAVGVSESWKSYARCAAEVKRAVRRSLR
jgi:hypothetical protein